MRSKVHLRRARPVQTTHASVGIDGTGGSIKTGSPSDYRQPPETHRSLWPQTGDGGCAGPCRGQPTGGDSHQMQPPWRHHSRTGDTGASVTKVTPPETEGARRCRPNRRTHGREHSSPPRTASAAL